MTFGSPEHSTFLSYKVLSAHERCRFCILPSQKYVIIDGNRKMLSVSQTVNIVQNAEFLNQNEEMNYKDCE